MADVHTQRSDLHTQDASDHESDQRGRPSDRGEYTRPYAPRSRHESRAKQEGGDDPCCPCGQQRLAIGIHFGTRRFNETYVFNVEHTKLIYKHYSTSNRVSGCASTSVCVSSVREASVCAASVRAATSVHCAISLRLYSASILAKCCFRRLPPRLRRFFGFPSRLDGVLAASCITTVMILPWS